MINKDKNMKIAVLTSGGDAPGMNSVIKTIVSLGAQKNICVYGVKDGYLGLYNNEIDILNDKEIPRITNVSGTFLGSARFPSFQYDLSIREKCAQNLKNLGIERLIIIGGNGSYYGAMKLEELGIKCIGIPATIDNDINKTDLAIGFSTAVNNIIDVIEKLRDTAFSHNRCIIAEVMGRDKGDLAFYSGIASEVDLIVTKENFVSEQFILDKIKEFKTQNRRHVIVVITEYILNVHDLAKKAESYSGFETRAQVLGHIQRGGTPTAEDRFLAVKMGYYAFKLLNKNIHDCGIGIQKNKIFHLSLDTICNSHNISNELFHFINYL